MSVALHLLFYSVLISLICSFQEQRCSAQLQKKLPDSETEALKTIKAKLNVKFWDLDVNPCSGVLLLPRVNPSSDTSIKINLTCGDCINSGNAEGTSLCHVVSILLKSTNLTGFLPEEMSELTHLKELDLTRNYINGSIPKAWARLPLVNLSLLGNRISGPLPEEIGNITTLTSMVLENNLFEGNLPQSIGNLTNLKRLLLSSNNFVGELPESMSNLKSLTDLRIDGTGISGKIPAFIGNWKDLKRLDMQGTSLEGPFPHTFADLKNLTDLKVTDMKEMNFPPLQDMNLKYLFLRNCSLSGKIPGYIGSKKNLDILDLSFNNFTGEIPSTFQDLLEGKTRYMFLSNNMLTGTIHDWMFRSQRTIDLSYNLFTAPDKGGYSQPQVDVNMVSSFSSSKSKSITSCLRKNLPCAGEAKNYELFINCGGEDVEVDGVKYETDNAVNGDAFFFLSGRKNWAYSSTGYYIGNSRSSFKMENMSTLNITNPQLYTSARTSASSLHYYGLCLQSGNYMIKLHFAEIIFTDDQTYFSVGRRFFDVFIQDQRVLKDFNIAEAANGTGKKIVKTFTTLVNDTLDIHLRWSGKGTNAIPKRGIYGPLISAISVTPNFTPVVDEGKKFSTGAIGGIVIASCVVVLLVVLVPFVVLRKKEQE